MEAELFLNNVTAGSEVKVLINRHCMKGLVFYSIDINQKDAATEYHYMTYDKDDWKYKFVASPKKNNWLKLEEAFSEVIFDRFHTHCQN